VTAPPGTVALVTGGSRGIGRAIARALIQGGARVAITGTSDRQQVDDAVRATVERFGGLDVLVNNAGIGIFRSVETMTAAEWRNIMETNLTGVFYCCQAALPHLRSRSGWIINISSLSSTGPFADGAAYCASKAGLNAFTEALMQEVRQDGIRVACVLPGSVRTEFGGRAPGADDWRVAPEDVAQAVTGLIAFPPRSLPSRIELRPSRPPRKG
jgi:NAD(P)-dependent dehydrogenase (short-subunit alcohol dehydrogenase family)